MATIWLSWLGDRRAPRIPVRLSLLVAQLVLTAVATSPAFGLAHRGGALRTLDAWSQYFWPLATASSLAGSKAQAYLAGLLLCIQEANLLVRWIVESLGLKPAPPPGDAQSERAAREYSRGRVIGTLERIAVYVLVLQGQYDALGLVLAAKGLARFQNLDDREFAEYFLIGTFLSVVLAGAIALAVQSIG